MRLFFVSPSTNFIDFHWEHTSPKSKADIIKYSEALSTQRHTKGLDSARYYGLTQYNFPCY